MDRPWLSPEESAAAEEEVNRGKQATNLLGRAASGELQEGCVYMERKFMG